MKLQEIKSRLRTEIAFLHPLTVGVAAGVTVVFGALFLAGIPPHLPILHFPRPAIPSFFFILFQLVAYALFGAGFALLLDAPTCGVPNRLRPQRTSGLLLFVCTMVLTYIWIPLVCRAGSYFLGVLLCGVILLALFPIVLLIKRFSLLASGCVFLFALWTLYILYLTLLFLFFS